MLSKASLHRAAFSHVLKHVWKGSYTVFALLCAGESLWRLPLEERYWEGCKSIIAGQQGQPASSRLRADPSQWGWVSWSSKLPACADEVLSQDPRAPSCRGSGCTPEPVAALCVLEGELLASLCV